MFFGYNPSRSASPRNNLFDYNPSRSTGKKSKFFSRPESGTRASIQPIGNPVTVVNPAAFQTLLNENNINPEVFANARKRSQASKMRQAYSSFLSGLG